MARKKTSSGPTFFAEWVIGTSLQPLFKPEKPRRRNVIRVEVTTDDESEADMLKITYPRSGKTAPQKTSDEAASKKVRFEGGRVKSSLKPKDKKKALSGSEDSTSEASIAEASSDASSNVETSESQASQESSANETPAARKKIKKKTVDPERNAVCKCSKCIKGRHNKQEKQDAEKKKKTKEKGKEMHSETDSKRFNKSSADDSESETEHKKSKKRNKHHKAKSDKSDDTTTDEATSEASATSDEEPKAKHYGKSGNAKKEHKKDIGTEAKDSKKKRGLLAKESSADKVKDKETDQNSGKAQTKAEEDPKDGEKGKNSYPEAFLSPHLRRPNFIGPIRAQVVQTEEVVETPEDPPPNAFYDAQHNIMRVYHGPVYGNNYSRSLYPKRDSSNRPLPIGMPHPLQNPYYFGFHQVPNPGDNKTQEAMAQGMQYMPYRAFPPYGYPPGTSSQPLAQVPGQAPALETIETTGTKGVFSRTPLHGSPSRSDDVTGRDNVAPSSKNNNFGSITGKNPYYSPRAHQSIFQGMGSNRAASNSSQRNGKSGNSPLQNSSQPVNTGETSADQQTAWPNVQDTQATNNEPANGDWNNTDQMNTGSGGSGDAWPPPRDNAAAHDTSISWSNVAPDTNQQDTSALYGSWGNAGPTSHNNDNDQGGGQNSGWAPSSADQVADNNVGPDARPSETMPGSWDGNDAGHNEDVPSWGDKNMAASTNGKIEHW